MRTTLMPTGAGRGVVVWGVLAKLAITDADRVPKLMEADTGRLPAACHVRSQHQPVKHVHCMPLAYLAPGCQASAVQALHATWPVSSSLSSNSFAAAAAAAACC